MRTLKRLGRQALASPLPYAVLSARAWRDRPVALLTYHTLGADDEDFDAWTVLRRGDFERQVAMLRRQFDVVDIGSALSQPAGARPRAVLTFDDGHRGWFEHLLPIVEREALPVTLYVATGHVEGGGSYWFDAVVNAVQATQPLTLDLRTGGLGLITLNQTRGEDNWLRLSALLEAMKAMTPEARDAVAQQIVAAAGDAPRPRFAPLAPLSVDEVRQLSRSRWVTIGSHSHGHELLDRIPLDAARESIARSLQLLRQWTGQGVRHFAYPNGNHDAVLAGALPSMGLDSAVTTRRGLWSGQGSRYTLPRVNVGRFDDLARLRLSLLG